MKLMKNSEDLKAKYGFAVVDELNTAIIYHFVAYEKEPTADDYKSFTEEIKNDPDLKGKEIIFCDERMTKIIIDQLLIAEDE